MDPERLPLDGHGHQENIRDPKSPIRLSYHGSLWRAYQNSQKPVQSLLLIIFLAGLFYTFVIKPEVDSKHLMEETNHIQKNIGLVHDLAEHISGHAQRCELLLKDTKDKDLEEISEHLKDIDSKVHELSGHVRSLEDKLTDEYERLGLGITPKKTG